MTVRYYEGVDLPNLTVTWRDSAGNLLDFSSGWSFELKVGLAGQAAAFTKTTGITGASTAPNVSVQWATSSELRSLAPGEYVGQLRATRISDNKRRAMQFAISIRPAIS